VPFFRDRRLLHMARAAHDEGALPSPLLGRIERLAARIDEHLTEPAHPSLLHGDLWTGNDTGECLLWQKAHRHLNYIFGDDEAADNDR
jgi:fructosamine-3-kinase